MPIAYGQEVHATYRRFAEKFIIQGDSLFTTTKNILTNDSIEACFQRYVVNYLEGTTRFADKIAQQFEGAETETRGVFAHAIWLWNYSVRDIGVETKRQEIGRSIGVMDGKELDSLFPTGFGNAATYHKNNKYNEIRFNLILIRFLRDLVNNGKISTVEDVLNWTEALCLFQKYDREREEFQIDPEVKKLVGGRKLAMTNIFCFLAKPEKYERIASDNHKWQIFSSFSALLSQEQQSDPLTNRDEKIALIRSRIGDLIGNINFDFYDEDDVWTVWNFRLGDDDFEAVQGLDYKRAIILYGPPGTSKTYSAQHLAKTIIRIGFLKDRKNVEAYLKGEDNFYSERLHHLQMHTNYNYEDFIAGMQLVDHNMKAVKGKLFNICEKARQDINMPHVLILDEINRVDLSRLFGEAFSALENREKDVEVSVGDFKLNIPKNLHVIGTMNEIDFSLERMDFALRRRFLWFEYGFNADTLRTIIECKQYELSTKLQDDEVNLYILNAIRVNGEISKTADLGKQYQIGHTFFGEIVEIVAKYKELNGYSNSLQKNIYRSNGPAGTLWQISIKPMIEAFLGNIDKGSKEKIVGTLADQYFHE